MAVTSQFTAALPVSAAAAFAWHERSGAFERLAPPWDDVATTRLTTADDAGSPLADGAIRELRIRNGPIALKWVAEHHDYDPPHKFCDRQTKGPFAAWEHNHAFASGPDDTSILTDTVTWQLPLAPLTQPLFGGLMRRKLAAMFRYRHAVTRDDLAAHAGYADRPRLRILIGGASGLVGTQLAAFLTTGGHDVATLVRRRPRNDHEIHWDPDGGQLDPGIMDTFEAVVHLGGANIAGARWSPARKQLIRDSRVDSTQLLADAIKAAESPPAVFVCASATGYYGSRADAKLTEDAAVGDDFLATVCRDWEGAAQSANSATRVVNARFGMVLSPAGGALQKMLPPFLLGGGGIVADGSQYWPWIAIDDVIGAIHHAIMSPKLTGPVNFVAPEPPTNRTFTKTLGRVIRRPTIVPLPTFAAKLILGELGEALLLTSARAYPEKLLNSGYGFRYPELTGALRHLLGKRPG